MTKVHFERSGGFLGQDILLDIDVNTLPAHEALDLLQLLQQADFFRLPENLVGTTSTDEFTYTISVEAGSARHRVRVSDTSLPESLRPLINQLSTIAMTS